MSVALSLFCFVATLSIFLFYLSHCFEHSIRCALLCKSLEKYWNWRHEECFSSSILVIATFESLKKRKTAALISRFCSLQCFFSLIKLTCLLARSMAVTNNYSISWVTPLHKWWAALLNCTVQITTFVYHWQYNFDSIFIFCHFILFNCTVLRFYALSQYFMRHSPKFFFWWNVLAHVLTFNSLSSSLLSLLRNRSLSSKTLSQMLTVNRA